MFTQPAPPSTTGLSSPTPDSAASSPPLSGFRGSRLRGLSYLRSYTQNHLLSRDSSASVQPENSASGAASGATLQHPPLTRAATHSTLSVTGRRRSRQSGTADDPPSTTRNQVRRTISAQTPSSSHDSSRGVVVEANSDSDAGRGKKHKTGTEGTDEIEDQTTTDAEMTRTRSATTGDLSLDMLPSIRFSAHYDPRSTRQSLSFTPVSRTLPTGKESIKVGRYSEREQAAVIPSNTPSAAPVGFKSKVVSRRHCEFWYEDGKWYIKDVKSSSGTFLNHIRLSPPGNESKPYAVNDGDIVQLGIDFRGGEEMIFRCVKMRIELNRGWQNKPNNFNMATHKRLRNLTSTDANANNAQDCSICLNAIAPCQSLFVAPCSHTWHYKCIRELLLGPSHPIFTCPNCRAAADLDADIEEPDEEWQHLDSGPEDTNMDAGDTPPIQTDSTGDSSQNQLDGAVEEQHSQSPSAAGDAGDVTMMLDRAPTIQQEEPLTRPEASSPVPIPRASPAVINGANSSAQVRRTPSPRNAGVSGQEGPLTPRNDAGPWVFDGDAGRASQDISRPGAMVNLDAAATQVESNAS